MIEKAIFSYFNQKGIKNTSGFSTFRDMVGSTCLAVLTAKKNFKKIEFITNDFGKKLFIDKLQLPVESNTLLNQMKDVSSYWWAYGKVLAYASQNEPFVHIDNDCYMFSGLPERMKKAGLVFQSKEFFDKPGYGWYTQLKPCFNEQPVKPKGIIELKDYAYNCGIAGGNNYEFFKEHERCSREYIFAPENQELFFKKYGEILIHQNLFHEQYFIASLIKAKKLRKTVQVLADNVDDINRNGVSFTHLWGLSKQKNWIINKMWTRFQKDYPVFYQKVQDLDLSLLEK